MCKLVAPFSVHTCVLVCVCMCVCVRVHNASPGTAWFLCVSVFSAFPPEVLCFAKQTAVVLYNALFTYIIMSNDAAWQNKTLTADPMRKHSQANTQ
jgi:hypothetical protein